MHNHIESIGHESDTQKKLMRLKRTASLIGLLGMGQAMPLLTKRLINSDSKSETQLRVKGLDHPFYTTAAHGDIAMLNELVGRGLYDLPRCDKAVDGKLIIDVGANIGVSAALFASRYKQSDLLLIEPNPRNLELLEANVSGYGNRITTIPKALSLDSERTGLINRQVSVNGHHASYSYIGSAQKYQLSSESILPEELISNVEGYLFPGERVGLLKMNIEGAEKGLMDSGRMDPLLRLSNIAIIEAHDRLINGASNAVLAAAYRSGMEPIDKRGSFYFFENQQ